MRTITLTDEQFDALDDALYAAMAFADNKAMMIRGGEYRERAATLRKLHTHINHQERIPKSAFTVGKWSFRPVKHIRDNVATGEVSFHVYRLKERTWSQATIEQNGPVWITHVTMHRARAFLSFAEARDHVANILEAKP